MYNFTFIVPCFNEEDNIEKFVKKTKLLFQDKYNYKVLFIDDGSEDKTWTIIENLKNNFSFINGIKLSKNFGKENAICCGLNNIKDDDFIITIDVDLQHPLEQVKKMIDLWKNGYQIVNTYRINRTESVLREIGSKFFYFFFKIFNDMTILSKATDFILIDKKVVKKFNEISEVNKQYRMLINWLGFKKCHLPIKINLRTSGQSKYKLNSLFKLAVGSITSFSSLPLKIIAFIGVTMTLTMLVILVTVLIDKFFFDNNMRASLQSLLIIIQILLTGLILTSISFLGVYIHKIINNTNGRPSYIIEKKIE